jgi:diguanylate cyclase (GGDEF)-like protein
MYSEFTQQLGTHELESLKDSLEYSAATHMRWISKINQSLICNQEIPETNCNHIPPHSHCSLTQWCDSVTNQAILDDPIFKKINSLHQQLHQHACDLIAAMKSGKPISSEDYSAFSDIEYNFFKVQSSIIQECTEALGVIDSLTNLPNKRAFHDILVREENRIKRHKFTSIIAVVDIDDFRIINQTHGYIAGDMLLIQLAALFKHSLRNFDTVARYAGDKFILYLPETDLISAEVILERFRQSIESTNFEIQADTIANITCTFGVSHIDTTLSVDKSLQNAWSSLDQAISDGRNCVGIDLDACAEESIADL